MWKVLKSHAYIQTTKWTQCVVFYIFMHMFVHVNKCITIIIKVKTINLNWEAWEGLKQRDMGEARGQKVKGELVQFYFNSKVF